MRTISKRLFAALAATLIGVGVSGAQTNDQNELYFGPDAGPPAAGEVVGGVSREGVAVVLGGLDKLTGETATLESRIGEAASYGRLTIQPRVCYTQQDSGADDASAFLQIYDSKEEAGEASFSGWMFSESPSLSAMDHARYDIWLVSCKIS